MSKNRTTRDGRTIKPVPKEANVTGLNLPDNVAPPISDSTAAALKGLIGPAGPKKLPRKGWGSSK